MNDDFKSVDDRYTVIELIVTIHMDLLLFVGFVIYNFFTTFFLKLVDFLQGNLQTLANKEI